ncbi:MAG: gliding motility lipoprotein GldD [Dysgonamonadaceae bacterium]|jgi:gliding motility-associated lipoprotein GldD|nr:gliding motility lipoprotein GldD [Dysgonamonadaceae bacterium]
MKNKFFFIPPVLFSLFLSSCSSDYSPKPRAYFYIDLPEPVYHSVQFSPFDFSLSNQAKIENQYDSASTVAFILNYPQLNAQIYCSYFLINKENFRTIADNSRKLAYVHEIKAGGIDEFAFSNPQKNVYGLVYEIKGNTASPVQFVLTDSVRSFFRGALYFNTEPNQDSITPVLTYINKDIQILIESFRWKL